MKIYLIMEKTRGYDQQRDAFIIESDAEDECTKLNEALPNSDGFYVEELEVKGAKR